MDSPSFELTNTSSPKRSRATHLGQRATRSLAEDGCITQARGTITTQARLRLLAHACKCYETIRRATDAAMAALP